MSRAISEHGVHRLPVVDDGKLTGTVMLDDLIATIGERFDNVADTVEVRSPDYSP